jgi:hypothetical protein
VNQTTPSPWPTRQKNSQNSGGSRILKICTIYGTLNETTQWGTAESSLISMQEKEKNKDKYEDNGKKYEDNTEDKGL